MDDPRRPVADGPVQPEDLEEAEFQALVGRWVATAPGEVVELLGDAPFPWWIAGGWALELQGGRTRPHDDTDVAFLLRDLPQVRRYLDAFHLWSPAPDRLRPILAGTQMLDDEEQLWVRRDASGPWFLDLLATPADGDDWVFKKDDRIRRPLSEASRFTEQGIPVLARDIVLLHKAGLDRERDRDDLAAIEPDLEPTERRWLRDSLEVCWPGHAWLELV